MNKIEFMSHVGSYKEDAIGFLSEKNYKTIEYVYTWHPCIDPVKGKEQIAKLYADFGMRVIKDMEPTAIAAQETEQRLLELKKEYEEAKEYYAKLKMGEV